MERELLEKSLREMRARLDDASARWGRVEICAVTKTVDVETINLACALGVRIIGENRVQEIAAKAERLDPGLTRHMIGRLQLNKVKQVLPLVDMIQSLDRRELLEEIDRRAQALGKPMPVLVQVNIAREAQKAGVLEEDLEAFVRLAASRKGVRVEGLMAIMPLVADPEQVRPYFRRMREWFDRLREQAIPGAQMRILSMGMSADCLVAAEEGATMVRPGRALFGARK
ncbi:MAG TPA: YggS family pyridoxal phosphate-dependent enzyme [Candidatus Pullichristensenella avicola]|nr:YggS family pyridoxal phosphate-dependent enzyme [Candidatus Pullichristensenella avicola]